jgi:DNA-binding NarL/FixJ family response regulator
MKTTIPEKPSIILVDDHLIFRQGLKLLINIENLGEVIGEASDGKEFIELLNAPAPDLVIMDIDMPTMNGIEATQKALQMMPHLKIIVFSMFGDEEYFNRMIEIGVKGFILKSSGITEVEKAIVDVMAGKNYFSNVLPQKSTSKTLTTNLTPNVAKPSVPIPWW